MTIFGLMASTATFVRTSACVCWLSSGLPNTGVAFEDGYRESEASWYELLSGLRSRGLTVSPKLATGDGAMGFWKALAKVFPDTRHQRCLVHKTAKVLASLSKSVQPKVKSELRDIWLAEDRVLATSLTRSPRCNISRAVSLRA